MPDRPAPIRPQLLIWGIVALLFGGTVLLYTPALGYGFVNYDDPRYVALNAHVQAPFTWSSVEWAFTARAELWQPLTWLSHIMDWRLYGENASGHHLTSILWHALNACLVFGVFRRLTGTVWLSALSAALFAWHPLRVESVVWVTERKDVMSGCFFLLTLWSYLAYAERRRCAQPAASRYGLTLVLFTAGLMCKPTLVTMPLLMLALDFWPVGRLQRDGAPAPSRGALGTSVVEKLPFLALSTMVGLLTIHLQKGLGFFTLNLPLTARLANVPVAMIRYLGKFFWPANLSVCYAHPGWWPALVVVSATVAVIVITACAWRWRTTQPALLVGWVWFVALLLPTIGILQVGFQSMADRYTYLPMLGTELALLGGLATLRFSRAAKGALSAAAAAVLLAAAARTGTQETVWRDSRTLFEHAIAAGGSNTMSEGFLGYTLASLGQIDGAVEHCERALALDPRNEMAVFTLARIHAAQGQTVAAIAGFRRSLELKPDDADTEYELALQLLRHDETEAAAPFLRQAAAAAPQLAQQARAQALQLGLSGHLVQAAVYYQAAALLHPDQAEDQLNAGVAFARLDRPGVAEPLLRRALQLKPTLLDAHVELGLLLLARGDPATAATEFQTVLEQDPHQAAANVGLGRVHEARGETADADLCFARALADAPTDANVARAWAETLARRGRFSDAVTYYQRAVALQPDAVNQAGLGYVLLLSGHRAEAAAAWREALRLDPNFPNLRERLKRLGD